MQGKVEICGVNTARLPTLDVERARELLLRARRGDRQARQTLIEGNLRLVLSVIQRFAARGESVDDLFQVGCVGLIKAVDNFDCEAHDVRFSTYGVPMTTEWRNPKMRFHHDTQTGAGSSHSSPFRGRAERSRRDPTYSF